MDFSKIENWSLEDFCNFFGLENPDSDFQISAGSHLFNQWFYLKNQKIKTFNIYDAFYFIFGILKKKELLENFIELDSNCWNHLIFLVKEYLQNIILEDVSRVKTRENQIVYLNIVSAIMKNMATDYWPAYSILIKKNESLSNDFSNLFPIGRFEEALDEIVNRLNFLNYNPFITNVDIEDWMETYNLDFIYSILYDKSITTFAEVKNLTNYFEFSGLATILTPVTEFLGISDFSLDSQLTILGIES